MANVRCRFLFLFCIGLFLAFLAGCSKSTSPGAACTDCAAPCTQDVDCAEGYVCLDGTCTAGGDSDTAPDGDKDDSDTTADRESEADTADADTTEASERTSDSPWIRISPNVLDFGAVPTNTSNDLTLTMTNIGSGTLTVSQAVLLNASAELRLHDPQTPINLTANQSATLTVTYSPTDLTADSGTLRLTSNDPDDPVINVPILTSIKAYLASQVTPDAIDFGVVRLGHYTADVDVSVTGGRSGTLSQLAVESASGRYSLVNPPTTPHNMTSDSHLTLTVAYDPNVATGTEDDAILRIGFLEEDAPHLIPLKGTPCEPEIDILPSVLDFTNVPYGQNVTHCATIRNLGCWPLTLSSAELTSSANGAYVIASEPDMPASLDKDASSDICFTFTPTLSGSQDGLAVVHNDDLDESEAKITLSGSVVPPDIECSPLDAQAGDVAIGQQAHLTITCRNTSSGVLHITDYTLSNADHTMQLTTTPTATTLALNDSVTFVVTYTAAAETESTGSLTIKSDDPDESPLVISLHATGYNPNRCPVALFDITSPAASAIQQFDTVHFDAARSYDPDDGGSIGSYQWTLRYKPATSVVVLQNATSATPTLYVDQPGTYTVSLTVTDNLGKPACEAMDVTFTAAAAQPSLSCTPLSIDYGVVDLGSSNTQYVTCVNNGYGDLVIASFEFVSPQGDAFSLSNTPADHVGYNSSTYLAVTYAPLALGTTYLGTLRIHSNDPTNPTYDISLRGGSQTPNTCPTASFTVVSPALTAIQRGDTVRFDASASNDPDSGDSLTQYVWEVTDRPTGSTSTIGPWGSVAPSLYIDKPGHYRVELSVKDSFNTFSCQTASVEFTATEPPPNIVCTPLVINFGSVPIGQSMSASVQCRNDGQSTLLVSGYNVSGSPAGAFVLANSPAAAIPPGMSTTIALTYTSSSQANDYGTLVITSDDPDEPQVTVALLATSYDSNHCPTAVVNLLSPALNSLKPLDTVQLDASASADPDSGDRIVEYIWTVLVRPSGSTSALQVQSGNPKRASLFLDLAGHYTIQLQTRDSYGKVSCSNGLLELDAIPRELIHLQLVWSTDEGDFDLHFLRPNGSLFSSSSDCFYQDQTPNWGSYGSPTLDIDDQHGYGPENINLNNPTTGAYTVYVHYYNSHEEHSTATVTVRIYLNGTLAGTYAVDWPESKEHYIWPVATINWDATMNTGTVTSLGTTLQSSSYGAKFRIPPKKD